MIKYSYKSENSTIETTDINSIPSGLEFEVINYEIPTEVINVVPESIARMKLKIILLLRGIEIQEIIDTINSIPDSMFSAIDKQIAIIKFNEAISYDRYNADLNLIAVLMGLTQEDLDDIFIKGNQL